MYLRAFAPTNWEPTACMPASALSGLRREKAPVGPGGTCHFGTPGPHFASEALDPNRASLDWVAVSGELPVCSGPLLGNAASPCSKKF